MSWFTKEETVDPYYKYNINLYVAFKKDKDVLKIWGCSWEKLEKNKQNVFRSLIHPKITYYPKMEAYKIIIGDKLLIYTKDDAKTSNMELVRETIASKHDEPDETRVEYSIWERTIEKNNNKDQKYLSIVKHVQTPSHTNKIITTEKILCELPLFGLGDSELIQFNKEWETNDRFVGIDFKDPFGERYSIFPTEYKHKASGIVFKQLTTGGC